MRDIDLCLRGVSNRRRDEHNQRVAIAHLNAKLSAYPPDKPEKFTKLDRLLTKPDVVAPPANDWRAKRDEVKAWAASFRTR